MMSHKKQREVLDKLVAKLQGSHYWGDVVLSLRDGNWVMTRLGQTALVDAIAKEGLIAIEIPGGSENGMQATGQT